MLTATFGFFDCPVCVDFYLVPDWKIRTMPLLSRVHVLCPGCRNTIQVCAIEIDTVHLVPNDYPKAPSEMTTAIRAQARVHLSPEALIWTSVDDALVHTITVNSRAKSAAALRGVTLRQWVLKAIEEKLKKGGK